MSGHSKWSTIKRKKGAIDAKRGKVFTKLIREITVAAKDGGGDEDSNPRLRAAVQNAKAANMPVATIERAMRRGTGEEPGTVYEEGLFEGYGPGGVAVMVETLADNRNRAVSEVRHVFTKHNGNLGESGAVAWMFERKGVIEVERANASEDDLLLAVMDAGGEDIQSGDEVNEVTTQVFDLEAVKKALEDNGIAFAQASLAWVPKIENMLEVGGEGVEKIIRLLEALEDLDDVQKVYSNFDLPEAELEKLMAEA
ncbi:YebC/PmpR family DNA-binding transcriptional regulator [Candidatus Latescibacteria bacterium]|nr:YebC/PmpR family DNA-binding transcriptional regulator [Candidatus Latescibacterota bacterium]